jgi:hypothetical protein
MLGPRVERMSEGIPTVSEEEVEKRGERRRVSYGRASRRHGKQLTGDS